MLPLFPRRILTDCRFFGLVLLALVVLLSLGYNILGEEPTPMHLNQGNRSPFPHSELLALQHPTFSDIREYERRLPQHQTPFKQGFPSRRYVRFSWEGWGSGWNNVFQEQLLNTHLAYLAHRGYIFVDYTPRDHPPFPDTGPNGTRHLLHIPMNAFTSGPTGRGSLGPNTDAIPRAASLEWWNLVCSTKLKDVVEVDIVATAKELNFSDATSGHDRLLGWASKLRDIEAPCVNVVGGSPFDYLFIGWEKVLSTWPSYGNSPVLKEFAWSSLITRALARNYALFSPSSAPSNIAPTPWAWPWILAPSPAIHGLLGIHVRRGDYEEHCKRLADWGSDYNAWNLFGRPDIRTTAPTYPQLPDHITVPDGMSRHEAVRPHCWPTQAEIVQRVRQVRAAAASGEAFPAQNLRTLYIATNGKPQWVAGLVALLREDGGEDEFAVAQAVDSAVLMSAETFIGVGVDWGFLVVTLFLDMRINIDRDFR
ncbi:hypothetical protein DFH06DRAFT_1150280 [Mycena polygramma]|nr:hypothetical protein DFH06DRAFT_1150280 [Mycena polygramma]